MGSSDLSVPFLEKIDDSSHEVTGVFTYKDKKKGRGRKLLPNPVKKCAEGRGIMVHGISKCDKSFIDELSMIQFDYVIVVSFGIILSPEVFTRWPGAWINVHPSMLPAYRGPSPMISALLDGATTTGVTINEVVYEVDTGRIFAQTGFNIADCSNLDDLEERVVKFGAPLLINVLDLIEDQGYKPRPQGSRGITHTVKIAASDLSIDWSGKAVEIVNKIRAFSTKPGAYTKYRDGKIKILRASVIAKGNGGASAGEIICASRNEGLIVNCGGGGAVSLKMIQPQGKKPMDHKSYINGYRPETGSIMGK